MNEEPKMRFHLLSAFTALCALATTGCAGSYSSFGDAQHRVTTGVRLERVDVIDGNVHFAYSRVRVDSERPIRLIHPGGHASEFPLTARFLKRQSEGLSALSGQFIPDDADGQGHVFSGSSVSGVVTDVSDQNPDDQNAHASMTMFGVGDPGSTDTYNVSVATTDTNGVVHDFSFTPTTALAGQKVVLETNNGSLTEWSGGAVQSMTWTVTNGAGAVVGSGTWSR